MVGRSYKMELKYDFKLGSYVAAVDPDTNKIILIGKITQELFNKYCLGIKWIYNHKYKGLEVSVAWNLDGHYKTISLTESEAILAILENE